MSLIVVASLATFTSCKKCVTCTVSGTLYGVPVSETGKEECGKRKEINDYIKECETEAASIGLKCDCK